MVTLGRRSAVVSWLVSGRVSAKYPSTPPPMIAAHSSTRTTIRVNPPRILLPVPRLRDGTEGTGRTRSAGSTRSLGWGIGGFASRSMIEQQRAEAVDFVGHAVAPQRPPIGRRIDRQHRLVEPELGSRGEPGHREIGADLDDGFDIGPVDFADRVAQFPLAP